MSGEPIIPDSAARAMALGLLEPAAAAAKVAMWVQLSEPAQAALIERGRAALRLAYQITSSVPSAQSMDHMVAMPRANVHAICAEWQRVRWRLKPSKGDREQMLRDNFNGHIDVLWTALNAQ